MTDLQALFDKDPLNLTTDEIEHIIKYYRAKRIEFNQTGKKKSEKVSAIDLDDLLNEVK